MLLAYQHLRDPDHGELWGDAAQLWARTFLYRCPFLSPERRIELRGKVVADPGWVDSHDFVTWVRDAVRADGKAAELTVVRIGVDGHCTVQAADTVWLMPG